MEKIEKRVTIDVPAERVWKALTDQDELKAWMLMPTTFEPIAGKEFTFKVEKMENWDGYIHCRVVEAEVNKKLVFTWNANMIKAETLVTILITEKDGKTEVTLIHTGWENLPADSRAANIEGHTKGWDLRFVQKFPELFSK